MEIGTRVGAIQSANAEKVEFYGYGIYEGDQIPSKEENELFNALGISNPKIKLDDGKIVWGFECWWASEQKIKDMIGNRIINIVKS